MVEQFVSSAMRAPKPGGLGQVGGSAGMKGAKLTQMGDPTKVRTWDHQSFFESGLENVGTVGDVAFGAQFLIPGLAWVTRNTLGRLPNVGLGITNGAGKIFTAPMRALETTTVEDALSGRAFGKLASEHARHSKAYAAEFGSLKGTAEGAEILANHSIAPKAAEFTSGAFRNDHFLHGWAQRGITKGFENLTEQATGHQANLAIGKQGMLEGTLTKMGIKEAPAIAQMPAEVQAIHDELGAFKQTISGEAHLVDMAKAEKHLGNVVKLSQTAEVAGHGKLIGTIAKDMGEMREKLTGVQKHMSAARNPKGAMATVGTAVKGASLFDVVFKGGMAAGAAYYGVRTITHASQAISYLKELNKDLTGKELGTLDLIMGNHLTPMMQEARANMIAKFGPETVAAAASAALNIIFMSKHLNAKSQALMIGAIGTQMAASSLSPPQHLLDSYIQIKDMQKQNIPVPVESYGMLLDAASADARAAGGPESRLVRRLAEEYTKEQIKPADLLKEIEGKDVFNKRAHRIAKEIKAEDAKKHRHPTTNKSLLDDKDQKPDSKINAKSAKRQDEKEHDDQRTNTDGAALEKADAKTVIAANEMSHEGRMQEASREVSS
ncbi:MAG: hypothetical protein MRY32_04625 [Rickettsiales bacterium]|nr:hypothetical protein [Rickettsiales bacterium]